MDLRTELSQRKTAGEEHRQLIRLKAVVGMITCFGWPFVGWACTGFKGRLWDGGADWLLLACAALCLAFFLYDLGTQWFRTLREKARFGPLWATALDRLQPGRPFRLRVGREVRRAIELASMSVSLQYIERQAGVLQPSIPDDHPPPSFIDDDVLWAKEELRLRRVGFLAGDSIVETVSFDVPEPAALRALPSVTREKSSDFERVVQLCERFWLVVVETELQDGLTSTVSFDLPVELA